MCIRCPVCDVAFQVEDESPSAEVRCGACGTRLGAVGDGSTDVDQPLDIEQMATLTERFAIARGYVDSSLAFTPDNQLLVTGGADDTVRMWEAGSGQALPLLHVGRNSVHSVALSPDGRTLALGHLVSFGIALQVWDWDARCVRFAFQGPSDVTSVAFTPEGK